MVRAAAVLALLAALALYYAFAERLPELSRWGEVAFLSFVLLPAAFLLVWLLLPLWRLGPWRVGAAVLALAALTLVLELLDLEVAANFAKLAAVTAAGWWFLGFFEAASWVLLVALLIVPVDIFSVATGPTKHIVEEQPDLFDVLSIGFPIPGIHATARLGLPDILFFALFLGAAARFHLRVGWTWVAMVLSFGLTLTLAVWRDSGGLPALPLLSAAFVLANADLLWRDFRPRRRPVAEPGATSASTGPVLGRLRVRASSVVVFLSLVVAFVSLVFAVRACAEDVETVAVTIPVTVTQTVVEPTKEAGVERGRLMRFSGNGDRTLPPVRVPRDGAILRWTNNGEVLSIFYERGTLIDSVAKEGWTFLPAGRHFLEIIASGNWTVTLRARP